MVGSILMSGSFIAADSLSPSAVGSGIIIHVARRWLGSGFAVGLVMSFTGQMVSVNLLCSDTFSRNSGKFP